MRFRYYATYAFVLIIAGLFSCAGPTEQPANTFTVKISGIVTNKVFSPLDSVQIVLDNPFRRDSVKSDGTFNISFTSTEKTTQTAKATFSRVRFIDTVITITYSTTQNDVKLSTVVMKALSASEDSVVTGRASSRPGTIVYLGSTSPNLSIFGAGGTDAANLSFEVRDSLGVPVDARNQTTVRFKFINNLVQAALNRDTAITNSAGRVSVQLQAGTKAGIAQVQAYATVKRASDTTKVDTIKSPVVSMPIYGGFPDSTHFSISAEKLNVAGLLAGTRDKVNVLVGDKYGNPAQPGTVVYFTTTGGIIQPSATTSVDGTVSVDLITGNPYPAGGIAIVTAQVGTGGLAAAGTEEGISVGQKKKVKARNTSTLGLLSRFKSGIAGISGIFSRSIPVVFSGKPVISSVDTNFRVNAGQTEQVDFTVMDANSNPLSKGVNIKVTSPEDGTDIELTGDIDKTLPDTQDKTFTKFSVSVRDKRTTGTSQNKLVHLTIDVAGDNGNATMSMQGSLLAGGSVTDSGKVGSIVLADRAIDTITVSGAGGTNSTSFRFQVLDVFGKPSKGIQVLFQISRTANGGEYISPTLATTDSNGYVRTRLTSGIRAGLVQVVASVRRDSLSLFSEPKTVYIRTGPIASIVLISISDTRLSVKGVGGIESAIMVFEGRDSLGNAIDASNAVDVKFTSAGDTVGSRVSPLTTRTDPASGRVTTSFTSGTKSGIVVISASANADKVKSSPVQIAVSGGPPDSSHFTLGAEKFNVPGGVLLNVRDKITALVGDKYGNPAREGTVVYFTTTGGVIQSSAATSSDGLASVDLLTGNPFPPGGIAVVTATVGIGPVPSAGQEAVALGKKGAAQGSTKPAAGFSRSIPVLFSGPTRITVIDTAFRVNAGLAKQVGFVVGDALGNPLSRGTNIKVTTTGGSDVELVGDIDKTLLDTQDKSFTQFSVTVRDKRTTGTNQVKDVDLKIEVTSDNGVASAVVRGRLLAAGTLDSGKVGRIDLVTKGVDSITVSGVGGTNSTQIQYQVVDVFGSPSAKIPVLFQIVQRVNGGEFLTPTFAETDSNGYVSTRFTSGIRSGLVQVVASVQKDTISISSDAKIIHIRTGTIASLISVEVSNPKLSVRGVGGIDFSSIVFEGRDSLGNAIDAPNAVDVTFTTSGDTAGSRISPTTARTGPATGRVTTRLLAGTKAGIIYVTASAKSGAVKSAPLAFSVSGGFPDSNHFALTVERVNVSVGQQIGTRDKITAFAGDIYGNPARQGSLISFTSTGGYVQPSATTDADGVASVDLIATEPIPANGIATVTAQVGSGPVPNSPGEAISLRAKRGTDGVSSAMGVTFLRSVNVLFSRQTRVNVKDTNFVVPFGSAKQIDYTVADSVGNPLSMGTSIKVSTSGSGTDVELTGDIDKTLPDTQDKAFTRFRVFVRDKRTTSINQTKSVDLKVDISSANGSATVPVQGRLLAAGVSDSGKVGRIYALNPAIDTLTVTGAGGTNSEVVQFKVVDVFDAPAKNVTVQFSFFKTVNGGEYVSPGLGISDVNGLVSTTVTAGLRSGTIQLIAEVKKDSFSVVSDPKTIYIKTGSVATIGLISISSTNLSVSGVGGTDRSTIVFEGRDSLGNPIDFSNQTTISFSMSGDTAGARITPASARTDPGTGRVTTSFTSGTKTGLVQILASASSGRVKSAPVIVTVSGGFPDSARFKIVSPKKNFSLIKGGTSTFTVFAIDKYGNPAKEGLPVSFTTSGGSVGSAATLNSAGIATTTLGINGQMPPNGLATVRAKTAGENGTTIQDSVSVVFSGAPTITVQNVANDTVMIVDGGRFTVNFKLADLNGNPVSEGHAVNVSVSDGVFADIGVQGDVNVLTLDTQDKVGGTQYSFTVSDKVSNSGQSGKFLITITVSGESGIAVKTLRGVLLAPGDIISVPPSARQPSQIAFLGLTNPNIFIAGVGNVENSTITYEVRDSLGIPIDTSRRVTATFSVEFFPNSTVGGGTAPRVIPGTGVSDEQGRLRTTVVSGTQAGVVKVFARVQLDSTRLIVSQPVRINIHAGFPDSAHFKIFPSRFVFPGFDFINMIPFTAAANDTFSNPVPEGTAIYFHSQAYSITAAPGFTDKKGLATVELITDAPQPITNPYYDTTYGFGYFWVYAQTFGRESRQILDSVLVVVAKAPIVVTGIPDSTIAIPRAGASLPKSITIKDGNGNPLPDGTTISASVSFTSSNPDIKFGVSGDIASDLPVVIPNASYARFTGVGITDFTIRVVDQSAGGGATIGQSVIVTITITSPGIGSKTVSFNAKVQ